MQDFLKEIMKKYNSKLHELQEKKKELGEAVAYVREIEQSGSEHARKFVVDQVKEEEKKDKTKTEDIATTLDLLVNRHFSYRRSLADYGNWLIEEIREKGWEMEYVPTDGSRLKVYGRWFETKEGVQLIVKDPAGGVYMRGFYTIYSPLVDEAAIKTLYVQAENVMDSYKGLLLSEK